MFKFFKILVLLLLNFLCLVSIVQSSENKIKIGLLVPLTGENSEMGYQIIKSTRIALKEINSNNLEIYPRDTGSDPNKTLRSALELKNLGAKIIIGPVLYKNLQYLEEIQDLIFVSLTNKTINLPKNVISSGVNASSQLISIKKLS